ncbi:kelch-like protein 3 isoform X2 [Acyrthosiphon pisum]|uniref:Uncharacterized protein n=1 Tax=Acyrthosiphon pisum TaxID=7029 RepID=A0A8R2JNY3_ACYPI|nr:kelch-like protein 3 isoform X2 [Acyrthosiphon pisum]
MYICHSSVGIGVLDGVMYVIGGYNGSKTCKSVEAYRPSVGVWTPIADLHLARRRPDSVEIYNPITNTWKLMKIGINYTVKINNGVVVNMLPPKS